MPRLWASWKEAGARIHDALLGEPDPPEDERMRDGTLCLLLRRHPRSQILLGWKKHGFGSGKWGGFGGKSEPGEALATAAVRELQEEAGVQVSEADLHCVAKLSFCFPFRPEWSQVVHVFVVWQWEGEPRETEEMAPAWFSLDEIPYDGMWDDSRYWLRRLLDGECITARFLLGCDNETVDWLEVRPAQDQGLPAPNCVHAGENGGRVQRPTQTTAR